MEQKNILRQNFLPQDIGQNKAEVIATRHSRAFGINISYVPEMFSLESDQKYKNLRDSKTKKIFVGCVDNNAARREIARFISKNDTDYNSRSKTVFWIDSGNERKSGQVIVGSNTLMDVTDLYPEILSIKYDSKEEISCADRMLQDEQNMFVNLTASNLILNYIKSLILNLPIVTNGCVFNIDNKFDNYYITRNNL